MEHLKNYKKFSVSHRGSTREAGKEGGWGGPRGAGWIPKGLEEQVKEFVLVK